MSVSKNPESTKTNKRGKLPHSAAARRINKWLALLATIIAIGGVFAFGFIAFIANVAGETQDTYDPLWMVYMIPAMLVIAAPVTVFIARSIYKHFDKLTQGMNDVANGKTDVYIPTYQGGAFTGIYEDFNKMAAEIAGIHVLRSQIVDSFSHELKTPVASINGFARLLLDDGLTEEKRKKYLQIIIKESDRLAHLAKNNLFLSKIDAQEIVSDKKMFSLKKQIQDVAISMENAWSEKKISLTADLTDTEYFGSPELLASVWQNLLSNAIKFTQENGEINITMTETDSEITVAVTDTGIGMTEQAAAHIFERYYQADASHASDGHGLGLPIVKRIIRLCGGKIEVKTKVGEGSEFKVTLKKS